MSAIPERPSRPLTDVEWLERIYQLYGNSMNAFDAQFIRDLARRLRG